EYRLGLRIQLRRDDRAMLEFVHTHLGIGRLCDLPANAGNSKASTSWRCEKISDLAEVLVPLFDAIPLRSKKAGEFAIWRRLVLQRYTDTMAGYTTRAGTGEEYRATFQQAIKLISDIRSFTG